MADLETAADIALVKTRELAAHIDEAEEAFTQLEHALDDARTRFETDWTALEDAAHALLERARAHTRDIDAEGDQARQALTQLDESLDHATSDWDDAFEDGIAGTTALATHVSGQEPLISEAAADAAAATRGLGERADALRGQLERALAEVASLLETDVANELREMQDAVRQRAEGLVASVAAHCDTVLAEAVASWEQRLAEVEQVVEEEFARARQHAADVVEYSLQECERGHDEAWAGIATLVDDLEALLAHLGEAVVTRTVDLSERRRAAEGALADAAAGVERMRAALAQELDTMARYEFVRV